VSFPILLLHEGQLALRAVHRSDALLAKSVACSGNGVVSGRRHPLPLMVLPQVFVAVAGVLVDEFLTTYVGLRRV